MQKRKIYFASRIVPDVAKEGVLAISSEMTADEIKKIYANHAIERENYIHNGHWILRPIHSENRFLKNNFPSSITPYHVWEMVRSKIEDSDAMLAIVTPRAYGTIAEIGYACGSKNIPVYILPEIGLSFTEIQDLWLVFQESLSTKDMWQENDIVNVPQFKSWNINSISEYLKFITGIVPDFISKP